MRIVFFGIYKIGIEALAALHARKFDLVAVVTKPSTPVEQQPVADVAKAFGLRLLEPESPREPRFLETVRSLRPDVIVVAGYHKMFPKELRELPPLGVVNLHLSLLPKYRGPAPWKWAIAAGETESGATVLMMADQVDAGDILGQQKIAIHDDDTGASLFERLCVLGAPLLADCVEALRTNNAVRTPQDQTHASYQSAPTDADARIRWTASAAAIRNLVRGFHPRPGAWTVYEGVQLTLHKVSLIEASKSSTSGTILDVRGNVVVVATAAGSLAIEDLTARDGRTIPTCRAGGVFTDALSTDV